MNEQNEQLKHLLLSLVNLEEESNEFKKLHALALTNLMQSKPIIPSESQISCYFDKVATRFNHEGFPNLETKLRFNFSKFIKFEKKSNCWEILHFLMKLSENPFRTDYIFNIDKLLEKIEHHKLVEEQKAREEKFNWIAYLQDGFEKFQLPKDDSEEEDESEYTTAVSCQPNAGTDTICENDTITTFHNHPFDNLPAPFYHVRSEREEVVNMLMEANDAKKWLTKNVQHSWWNDNCNSVIFTNSLKYTFGIEWEKACCRNNTRCEITYLSMHKIIRELLWYAITDEKSKTVARRLNIIKRRVSVPSLSQEVFSSLMDDFLNAIKKYKCIVSFCEQARVHKVAALSILKYSSVLKEQCKVFVDSLMRIENEIIEQDKTTTLLTVIDRLKQEIDAINFLYYLHNRAIPNGWTAEIPWLTVTRLLSVLYMNINTIISASFVNLSIRLFVRTLSAYINIIDTWLSEGTLHDLKKEFIISRVENGCDHEDEKSYTIVPFKEELSAEQIKPADFLTDMAEKLIICSYNVEILRRLNKLTVLKQNINDKGHLYDSFQKRVTNALDVFMNNACCPQDPGEEQNNEISGDSSTATISVANGDNGDDCDPFLSAAFNSVRELRPIDCGNTTGFAYNLDQLTNNNCVISLMPIRLIISRALGALIESRENATTNLFEKLVVRENCLFEHMQTLGSFLLMDCYRFCSELYQMTIRHEPERYYLLSGYLLACVESNKLRGSEFFHITVSRLQLFSSEFKNPNYLSISCLMKFIDLINVQYQVPWPVNIVITTHVLNAYYVRLFRQILKLTVAYSTIARHKEVAELCQPHDVIVRRLYILRYWILQLLRKIKSYLMPIIEHHFKTLLTKSYIHVSDIYVIKENYINCIDEAMIKCFQNDDFEKYIQSAYSKLWNVCDVLQDCLIRRRKLKSDQLNYLAELYVQCLNYFIRIIERAIKRNSQYFDCFSQLHREMKSIMKNHTAIISTNMTLLSNCSKYADCKSQLSSSNSSSISYSRL